MRLGPKGPTGSGARQASSLARHRAPPERPLPPPVGPAPDQAALHAAALTHLARYSATEAGLRRVLERRVDRWARRAAEAPGAEADAVAAARTGARALAAEVARKMVAAGAVDDAAYAAARAARLRRAGRSRRAIAAHLGAKGVSPMLTGAVVPDDAEAELLAALAWCRRRRAGPFGALPPTEASARRKVLAAMARAGFGHSAASGALAMPPAEAVERLERARAAV